MTKIVVIGDTGLIGSKLVPRLAEHGHEAIAAATEGNTVRLSHALIQPIAADAVASALARAAVGEPSNGTIEVAGPEQFGLDELIGKGLRVRGDPREVVADPEARCFGALLQEGTLLPGADALILDPTSKTGLLKPPHSRGGRPAPRMTTA